MGVLISKQEEFEEKYKKIIKDGADKFHVLTDFDNTLTKRFVGGIKTPSIISILRDYNYLDEEYSNKAKEFFKKYNPIEENPNISYEEKKKVMQEWWNKHFDLLIKKGLNKKHLKRVVNEEKVKFRTGVLEFLDFLYKKNIPLIILSSSGLGNAIPIFLEKEERLYDNINIITNLYEWDKNGNAISVKKPIIHSMNKDETVIKNYPRIYNKVKSRKNVLLLGDSLGDLGMIKGFDYDNLISVGFFNEKIKESLEKYQENFDVVITNDGDFKFVNEFLKIIN